MIRVVLSLVLLALLAAPLRAEDDEPERHAFLEVVTPRGQVVVGEPFTVSVCIDVDPAFFDEHAVELFQRPLDLPVQIDVPWLAAPAGTRALEHVAPRANARLAVGGREVPATRLDRRQHGEVDCDVYEISRRYLPEAPGTLELGATLRFGYATRFEEDFLGGRLAVDRRDVRIEAQPLVVQVVPLPEAGRPDGFHGAVGRYTVTAALAPSGSDGNLWLTLVIQGDGNLAFVEPPPPECLAGFHVYGLVDDRSAPRRTVVYEIAPLAGTTAVPAVPFAFFDPEPPAGYRVVHTDAIPLGSPPAAVEASDEPAPVSGFPWSLLFGVLGLLLTGAAFQRLRRARAARSGAGAPTSSTVSTVSWSEKLAEPGADPTALLTDALASHLGVPAAAVIGPKLRERLIAVGVEADLATRTAGMVEALVGARFGGAATDADTRSEVTGLLTALDAAFHPDADVGGR